MATNLFTYRRAPELATGRSGEYPVIVVGAGPVGLCAAIDLAQHGVDCVLLDEASAGGTVDHRDHPGLKRPSGHIGFLGHGSIVEFRNIRIRESR